jgi:hypothetical protein
MTAEMLIKEAIQLFAKLQIRPNGCVKRIKGVGSHAIQVIPYLDYSI